jgi:membrane fusion protein (multidrug efflux system)
VLVPRVALRVEEGSPTVFVYRDGRVERRSVRLGQTRGDEQEVVAGVSDGEQVVTTGLGALRDGQRAQLRQ